MKARPLSQKELEAAAAHQMEILEEGAKRRIEKEQALREEAGVCPHCGQPLHPLIQRLGEQQHLLKAAHEALWAAYGKGDMSLLGDTNAEICGYLTDHETL